MSAWKLSTRSAVPVRSVIATTAIGKAGSSAAFPPIMRDLYERSTMPPPIDETLAAMKGNVRIANTVPTITSHGNIINWYKTETPRLIAAVEYLVSRLPNGRDIEHVAAILTGEVPDADNR
jgi:hypothetical protein